MPSGCCCCHVHSWPLTLSIFCFILCITLHCQSNALVRTWNLCKRQFRFSNVLLKIFTNSIENQRENFLPNKQKLLAIRKSFRCVFVTIFLLLFINGTRANYLQVKCEKESHLLNQKHWNWVEIQLNGCDFADIGKISIWNTCPDMYEWVYFCHQNTLDSTILFLLRWINKFNASFSKITIEMYPSHGWQLRWQLSSQLNQYFHCKLNWNHDWNTDCLC